MRSQPATAHSGSPTPGPDAGNFVGSWAAQAAWCNNATGPERPIRITTTTFEGYENSCRISRVQQVNTAYEALLDCTSEGTTTQERVRMRVADDRLTLSWLDRAGSSSTEFVRCQAPPIQNPPEASPPISIPPPEPTG